MILEPSFFIGLVAEVKHDRVRVDWFGFEIGLDIFETVCELIILVYGVLSFFTFSIFERLVAILIEILSIPCCACVMILIADLHWRNLASKVLGSQHSKYDLVLNFFAFAEQLEFRFCSEIVGAVRNLISLLLNWHDGLDEIVIFKLMG